ncbi:hypothetical protein ACQ86N_41420 [Puia sp. P3]|uniref:F0F1 ATP synthase subunit B family protein n=1 Tax=Puia sp. P3 TaxID=3423952 RepID=UPI003D6693AB
MPRRSKLEMAQMKSENEALLAKAREERAQMLKEARDTKDKMIAEAKEQAKVEAGKIIADAQAAIETQKMAAITDIKNQVGSLVVEAGGKSAAPRADRQEPAGKLYPSIVERSETELIYETKPTSLSALCKGCPRSCHRERPAGRRI